MVTYSKQYQSGNRLVICDVCGFGYRFSEMRKGVSGSQKGFNVCPTDFDPGHPLDNKPEIRKTSKLPEVR